MKKGMGTGEIFPLFCGAAELTYGTRALLSKIAELLPSPADRPPFEAQKWGSAERVTLSPSDGGPLAAQVFKTIDRKSTRLNSSHLVISYAVFCLKKKEARRVLASGW